MPDSNQNRENESENAESSIGLYDLGDNVDPSTFEQILEMDDDEEEREFSKSIVLGFFEQAETTFTQMNEALESKDLAALSALGHFLKGSSATLGLTKVKNSCEKIQHFGQKKDHDGIANEGNEDRCLERIENTLKALKKEYAEAVRILKTFFGMMPPPEKITECAPSGLTSTSSNSTTADSAKSVTNAAKNVVATSSTSVEAGVRASEAPEPGVKLVAGTADGAPELESTPRDVATITDNSEAVV